MPSKIFGIWSAPTSPLQLDNTTTPPPPPPPHLPTYQQSTKSAGNGHNANNGAAAAAASSSSSSSHTSHTSLEVRRPSINMDHIKRPALFAKKHSGSSHEKKAKSKERSLSKDKHARDVARSPRAPKPVQLGLLMESPPILMLDAPSQSSGALISGRLQITPNVPEATLSSIIMFLECTTMTKKPVQDRCRECMSQVKDLFEWHFLAHPKTLTASDGMYEMPFSQVIPGHIPATTHGTVTSIDYQLHVRARAVDGQEIEFRRELIIKRALRPGNDKNSIRVFPPTNLALHVTLPNVVHPSGEFNVQCRMTGIVSKRDETQTRWRLRKLTWRIEEHETAISPACPAHAAKLGGAGKGIEHQNTRDIGMGELKQGWKTDFSNGSNGDGCIEGEFTASILPSSKPNCGMSSPTGTKISHNMITELVIAEEWAPNRKPTQATPTGAARVLRTQFALNVTERAGMGIAWDDEQPPMYEDVPASPPHYPSSYQGHRSAFLNRRACAVDPNGQGGSQRGSSEGADPMASATMATSSGQNSPHNTEIVDYEGPDLDRDVEQLSLNG